MNKEHITNTAINMAETHGLINLTRASVCEAADVPEGSFTGIMGCSFTDFISKLKRNGVESENHYDVIRSRTDPKLRMRQILVVAVDVAREVGYNHMTREQVAEAAGVSMGLVSKYFNTMCQLRRDVMRYAVKNEVLEIIAQGLVHKDKHARKASDELKDKALSLLK